MKLTDLNLYATVASFAMPPAGGIYQDPTLGTIIRRVTGPDDGDTMRAYSAIQDFAIMDSSSIAYQGLDGSRWVALNVAKRSVSNKRKLENLWRDI